MSLTAVDLFAGAGGLAIGASRAGFRHVALVENDKWACETIRENQRLGHALAASWPLFEEDVRRFDYRQIKERVDLLCAGVPCQPFSIAGKARAHEDDRDMFAEVVRAARALRPRAILLENVSGLHRRAFQEYLSYLLLALATPELAREPSVSWQDHLQRLRKVEAASFRRQSLRYDVYLDVVNAADFGVPQTRERLFIVAFRSDIKVSWAFPKPTHSLDALLLEQWDTKEYWNRHGIHRVRPGRLSRLFRIAFERYRSGNQVATSLQPWRTVRDALMGLPSPGARERGTPTNHSLNPGAKPYDGHSGSLLDEPAKTIKAGSHGVPGGENSLSISKGKIRYFSVRECARLQTFPDEYVFVGPWIRMMRQLGNAVPAALAETITTSIHVRLSRAIRGERTTATRLLPFARTATSLVKAS